MTTRRIVDRFIHRKISFAECIVAIDSALPRIFKKIASKDLPALRAMMLTNNARIMEVMERREQDRKLNRKRYSDPSYLKRRGVSRPRHRPTDDAGTSDP